MMRNNFVVETIFVFLLPSDHSFYSTIVALYTLLFLYSPAFVFRFVFSPVLITTSILLLHLLRFFAAQQNKSESRRQECERNTSNTSTCRPDPDPYFVEWDVRAPLEVIYEEYGVGEDGELGEDENDAAVWEGVDLIQRYASLARFYPESDGDSSSEENVNFPEDLGFRWDEEDKEGLIEIELDQVKSDGDYVDEENLIEIDLHSPSGVGLRRAAAAAFN